MHKSHKGKLYSFKFRERKDPLIGVLLDFNDNWTLIKQVVDYSFDGYMVFKNQSVEYCQGEYEKFAATILKKKYGAYKSMKVPLDSLKCILKHLSKKYKLLQLDVKDGTAFDIVRYLGFE